MPFDKYHSDIFTVKQTFAITKWLTNMNVKVLPNVQPRGDCIAIQENTDNP